MKELDDQNGNKNFYMADSGETNTFILAFSLLVTKKTKDKNIIYPTIKFAKAVIDMVYSCICV